MFDLEPVPINDDQPRRAITVPLHRIQWQDSLLESCCIKLQRRQPNNQIPFGDNKIMDKSTGAHVVYAHSPQGPLGADFIENELTPGEANIP